MGWSRDIGICTPEEVSAKVAEATAHARGILTDEQAARRASILAKLNASREVGPSEFEELKELNLAASVKMSSEEIALIEKAAKVAEEGVRVMGGSAHVTLGGSDKVEDQPEAVVRGVRQTSISVTLTVTEGHGRTVVPTSPAKQGDNSVPWEPQ